MKSNIRHKFFVRLMTITASFLLLRSNTSVAKKVKITPLLIAFSLIFGLMPSNLVYADANKLYVTPVSSQMNLSTIFTINVRSYADSDQTIGNTSGTVTYPIGQLKVTGISVSGSGYGSPTITQGSGTIGFSASRNPAPSGTAQIFAITFQAIGAGSAIVNFTNDSKVNDATTTYSTGTYTITNPNPTTPAPPTPKAISTPKSTPVAISSTPSPTPSPVVTDVQENPQPTPDPTGLIDTVSVDPLYSSSTISWTVNANSSTSTLVYGENASKMDRSAGVTKKSDGTFTANLTGLAPGIRYFFTINASAPGGKSGTYSGVIPTRGYPVTVAVTENKNPVQSGQIKIGSQSSPIPSGGKVTLGLAAGSYSGTISTETASLNINLTVVAKTIPTDGTAPESQSYSFDLTSSPLEQGPGSNFSVFAFIGVLLGGTVVLGLGFVGFMAYRRRQFEKGGDVTSYNENPTVIIDDGYDWKSETAQNAPIPDTKENQPLSSPVMHHNSVYMTDEEPVDMFDVAQKTPQHQLPNNPTKPSGTAQNPNSPHSTTT